MCDDSQRRSFVQKYSSQLKFYLTRLFCTFLVDLAGPLLMTTRGLRSVLIYDEHLTGWSLAYPTSSATASEVTALIMPDIVFSFG